MHCIIFNSLNGVCHKNRHWCAFMIRTHCAFNIMCPNISFQMFEISCPTMHMEI